VFALLRFHPFKDSKFTVRVFYSRLLPVGNTTAIANYNLQDVTTNIVRVNYDWTISPTLLNHVGFGFSRFRNPNFSLSYNQGWEQPNGGKLGLTGTQYDLFPTIQFSTQGYTRFGDDIASDNYFNTFTVLDNLTWIRGKHTIKMGAETQAHRDNYRNFGTGGGSFFFSALETGLPGVANAGNAFASFLLGAVDNGYSYFRSSLPGGRYKYYGAYIDDTFKVSTRLTLDFGVRWDYFLAARFEDGLQYNWDPKTGNVIVPQSALASVSPLYPKTITVAAGQVVPNPSKANFAPRLAAAYRLAELPLVEPCLAPGPQRLQPSRPGVHRPCRQQESRGHPRLSAARR